MTTRGAPEENVHDAATPYLPQNCHTFAHRLRLVASSLAECAGYPTKISSERPSLSAFGRWRS